jgi:hypothetical protein
MRVFFTYVNLNFKNHKIHNQFIYCFFLCAMSELKERRKISVFSDNKVCLLFIVHSFTGLLYTKSSVLTCRSRPSNLWTRPGTDSCSHSRPSTSRTACTDGPYTRSNLHNHDVTYDVRDNVMTSQNVGHYSVSVGSLSDKHMRRNRLFSLCTKFVNKEVGRSGLIFYLSVLLH